MSKKSYDWENGAILEPHSKIKLKILGEYFEDYLQVRCVLPQQEKFRVAIVDGFAGAGSYSNGESGSPIVFLKTLMKTEQRLNLERSVAGFRPLTIECYFEFNDIDATAIKLLKENLVPFVAKIIDEHPLLKITINYSVGGFEENSKDICGRLRQIKFRNVMFNLDQYGYKGVSEKTLKSLLKFTESSEVFLTFAIESFLTYLSPNRVNKIMMNGSVPFIGDVENIPLHSTKPTWLGAIEKVVFEALKDVAPYVSPFSIHNPEGWRYWFLHFANHYRARQVYNDILHRNKSAQAHFGGSGLRMLSYNPDDEKRLYLFDQEARSSSRVQLHQDIPSLIINAGREMHMRDFFAQTYSETAAHSDDINLTMMENSDLEIITSRGGARRKSHMIKDTDIVRVKPQKTFWFLNEI